MEYQQTKRNVRNAGTNTRSKVTFADDILYSDGQTTMNMSLSSASDYIPMSRKRDFYQRRLESTEYPYVEMTPLKSKSQMGAPTESTQKCNEKYMNPQPRKYNVAAKSVIKGKSILNVAVYVNGDMVTINVLEARHLQSSAASSCNTFVKVALIPETAQTVACCTDLSINSNHPIYEEKFSFELLPDDLVKRLYISVWHVDSSKSRQHELLGSMSFGLQHIITKRRTINGWYYLLEEETGKRKHVQAIGRRREAHSSRKGVQSVDVFNTAVLDDIDTCTSPIAETKNNPTDPSHRTGRPNPYTCLRADSRIKASANTPDSSNTHFCDAHGDRKSLEEDENTLKWSRCHSSDHNSHLVEDFGSSSGVIGRAIRQCVSKAFVESTIEGKCDVRGSCGKMALSAGRTIELFQQTSSKGLLNNTHATFMSGAQDPSLTFDEGMKSKTCNISEISRLKIDGGRIFELTNITDVGFADLGGSFLGMCEEENDKENCIMGIPRKRKHSPGTNSFVFETPAKKNKRRKIDSDFSLSKFTKHKQLSIGKNISRHRQRHERTMSFSNESSWSNMTNQSLSKHSNSTTLLDKLKGLKFKIPRTFSFKASKH